MAKTLDQDLEFQKKLLGLKESFGRAKTDEERQAISMQGDELRASRGIQAGSEGQVTADELRANIQQQEERNIREELEQARRQEAIGALEQQYAAATSALDRERASISPTFEKAEREQIQQKQRADKRFSDFVAERGQSGLAAQGQLASDIALGSGLAQLGRQEQAQMADLAQRQSALEQAKAQDIRSTVAGLSAEALERQIEDQRYRDQLAMNQAGITGTFQGAPTLAAQQQQFTQGLQGAQFNESQRQFNVGQALRERQFEQEQAQFQANYGLNLRQQSFAEAQARIENALRQNQINISAANSALQQAKYLSDNDPNSLDNQIKQAQLEKIQTETSLLGPDPVDTGVYEDFINSQYVINPTTSGGVQRPGQVDTEAIRSYVLNLADQGRIDEGAALRLLQQYGVPPTQ